MLQSLEAGLAGHCGPHVVKAAAVALPLVNDVATIQNPMMVDKTARLAQMK